jgi:hypothetical protein
VRCARTEFCRAGVCVTSCLGIGCPSGQSCLDGTCRPDVCAGITCNDNEVCNPTTGRCGTSLCQSSCMVGQGCNPSNGACMPDPCARVQCGACQTCVILFDGTATCPVMPICQVGVRSSLTGIGGGGCSCDVGALEASGRVTASAGGSAASTGVASGPPPSGSLL